MASVNHSPARNKKTTTALNITQYYLPSSTSGSHTMSVSQPDICIGSLSVSRYAAWARPRPRPRTKPRPNALWFLLTYRPTQRGACIDSSWTCGTSTLVACYFNFIARQLYVQNSPNSSKIQYWPEGSGFIPTTHELVINQKCMDFYKSEWLSIVMTNKHSS